MLQLECLNLLNANSIKNITGVNYDLNKIANSLIKTFENFDDVIKKYDSPTTYIYLDPPYWKTENYYSNHDFDRDDHERLANSLKNVKSKFSLSYYDFELLHTWFPKNKFVWVEKDFAKAAAASKGKKQNKGTELLIMNYAIPNFTTFEDDVETELKDSQLTLDL